MQQSFHFYLLNAALYCRAPQQPLTKAIFGTVNSTFMKLAIIEVLGLIALLILPLFASAKSKKKSTALNNVVELSDYAINEDGNLEELHPSETDLRRAG